MSAFGKRGGMSGARPSFGTAKPMKSGPGTASKKAEAEGGDQFPPLEELEQTIESATAPEGDSAMSGAMDRLTARQNASSEPGNSKQEGFEAAVHRIKEQVLPRLLERVD